MRNNKLDLHTLSVVLMVLNGWHIMPKEKNEVFFHRLIANNTFASDKAFSKYQHEAVNAIAHVFDHPAVIGIMPEVTVDKIF